MQFKSSEIYFFIRYQGSDKNKQEIMQKKTTQKH